MGMPELMEEARKANITEVEGVKKHELVFQILSIA